MFLIVGLGNPGGDYAGTRHNIGFAIIDMLVSRIASGNRYKKFNSEAYNASYAGKDLLIIKPRTFMNRSGSAAAAALSHMGEKKTGMLVVHDDIDIEFGRIKIKRGGSTAGHRGLQSIFDNTGGLDFDRLRFGVGRPPGRMEASDYVLRPFNKSEKKELDLLIDRSVDMIREYIKNGLEYTANKYN